jgi:hypothetical protein
MSSLMKQKSITLLQFSLRTYQASLFWLPAAIWALFAVMVGLFGKNIRAVEVSSAFLGVVLPLIGGILGAYAILDDPALELQFAAPHSAMRMLVERISVILVVLALAAATYQAFIHWIGLDMSQYGNLWQRQLAWIIPCVALTALGCMGAFATAQSTSASMLVGMIWILQVIARDWFMSNSVGKYLFLFTGALYPKAVTLIASQIALLALSLVFFIAGWLLLQKQERYI